VTPEDPQALAVALEIIGVLEELGVAYHLGGSYASSVHGVPRQTHDVDLVADLHHEHLPELARRLGADFYLDLERAARALERRTSFNLVHLATGVKVDLFLKRDDPYDDEELRRSIRIPLGDETARRTLLVKSPEDTLLRKLQWFRAGGEVSDRQWSDIQGVLRIQGEALDHEYLRRWAPQLGVTDLLERAVRESRSES
jgi:hypothetical protein